MLEKKITTSETYNGNVKQVKTSASGFGSFSQERYDPDKSEETNHDMAVKRSLPMFGYTTILSRTQLSKGSYCYTVQ